MVFMDEVGFSLKTSVTRTWAKAGQTPLVKTPGSWDKLSTIGGITSTGQFLQWTHDGAIKAPQVAAFFQHVLAHVQGEVIVVLENAGIHKAKPVRAFVDEQERLSLVFLPPYAPELNPIEWVWAFVKKAVLGNFCPKDLGELREKLKLGWRRIRRSAIVPNCFAKIFPALPSVT